eukprot:Sspe_Gene.78928::Locus_49438_Transcript_1_2_Confidence_0.500_Length_1038::g.78928::m.78928
MEDTRPACLSRSPEVSNLVNALDQATAADAVAYRDNLRRVKEARARYHAVKLVATEIMAITASPSVGEGSPDDVVEVARRMATSEELCMRWRCMADGAAKGQRVDRAETRRDFASLIEAVRALAAGGGRYEEAAARGREYLRPQIARLLEAKLDACEECCEGGNLAAAARELVEKRETEQARYYTELRSAQEHRKELNLRLYKATMQMCEMVRQFRIPCEHLDPSKLQFLLALLEALQGKVRLLTSGLKGDTYTAKTVPMLRAIRDTLMEQVCALRDEDSQLTALLEQYKAEEDADPQFMKLNAQHTALASEIAYIKGAQ